MKRIALKTWDAIQLRAPSFWLVLTLLLLSGCAAVVPAEEQKPPFSEKVLESLLGSTNEDIEQKFGRPNREFLGKDRSYFVYQGRRAIAFAILMGLPIPMEGQTMVCSILEFGPDLRLRGYDTFGEYVGIVGMKSLGDCENYFWSDKELAELQRDHEAEIEKRVEEGDPETAYDYAYHLDFDRSYSERFRWYCLAAQAGHAKARYQLGRYYQHGYGIEENARKAYQWYTLSLEAEHSDEVARQREQLLKDMTPEQIAEAERLAAEWQSNPAECEVNVQGDK